MYFHLFIRNQKTASTMKSSRKNFSVNMKKKLGAIALSCMLLTFVTAHSYAQQSIQYGIKGGGNFYKLGGRSFDNKFYPGFNLGAYAELNFAPHWTLQPELIWDQAIAKTSDNFNQIYRGVSFQQVDLNYAMLPILVAFKPVPELSILLGPQVGYLFSQTSNLPYTNPNQKAFSKVDFSLVFGGQLNLGKVKIGARYAIGLNDINGINSSDGWRKYGFQFYLAYQLKDIKLKK
jgi:hypothetical protein